MKLTKLFTLFVALVCAVSISAAPIGSKNGMMPKPFTVNATGKKVWFSQGNLQHSGANTTGTWSFATNQYERSGTNQSDDHRDLFGWGTKTTPNNTSTNDGEYTWADWGENKISNGGNLEGVWNTLTADEWQYLFNRTNYRTMATVHSVLGLILMPDGWTASSVNPTITVANYTTNVLTDEQWAVLEGQGCVFLPVNGWRNGTDYSKTNEHAIYWTSTTETNTTARDAYIDGSDKHDVWTNENHGRHLGFCVRLVLQYWEGSGTAADPYLINNVYDWNKLSYLVSNGHTFADTCFRQTGDFTITSMVGTAINANGGNLEEQFKTFNGTYDGYGHTLNVNLNVTGERYAGPFRCVINATIRNLIVTGSVTVSGGSKDEARRHPAALIGTSREGSVLIENCRVSANVSGADYIGGILGHSWHANVTMIGCVYSGTLTANGTNYTGGLIGWGGDGGGKTIVLTNNLFAGSYSGSGKFHPVGVLCTLTGNTRTVTNAYYTVGPAIMTDNDGNSLVNGLSYKGERAYSVTGGAGVTVAAAGEPTATYNVSGLDFYGTNGFALNGALYGGQGDAVSLNLTATNHAGYSVYDYTASAGTLTGSDNPYSLAMPAANVTINARYSISKSISAYTQGGHDGWYLIASPIGAVSPSSVNNMTSNTYDIFRFNQNPTVSGGLYLEWENWNQAGSHYHFNLLPGKGYLYANNTNVTLTFVGTPYSGSGEVSLSYSEDNPDKRMWGWNLIGNPFGESKTIGQAFYRMNNDHTDLIAATGDISPMEGIFVYRDKDNGPESVTFTTNSSKGADSNANHVVINLSSGLAGTIIDRAIVSFDEGHTLPKFQINESSTKLYIPQNGGDYAIAFSDRTGEMPLNFKAAKNGSYTLTVDAEDIEAGYLHLIDNMTGANVDLLVQPSYTFNAKTTDYESRFKLVFGNENDNDNENEPFAYISNGEIIINGEGTVQVIDMLGHQLLSKEKTSDFRLPTSGFSSGVYVLRLITATETKTQKIVVKE